jgi:hypothetical protein
LTVFSAEDPDSEDPHEVPHLAHFGVLVPRRIVFGFSPKTATGKIQKFGRREHATEIALRGVVS